MGAKGQLITPLLEPCTHEMKPFAAMRRRRKKDIEKEGAMGEAKRSFFVCLKLYFLLHVGGSSFLVHQKQNGRVEGEREREEGGRCDPFYVL